MSQIPAVLNLQESDVKAMLACGVHLGGENVDAAMKRYVHKRNDKGIHIIDVRKTWEKLVLAARVIVAIENPKDVCVVALSPAGQPSMAQRAVLKFSHHTGARSIAGRITPGTFTNHRQSHYMEPRLVVTSDPRIDHQPILEASYVNIPVISFVNTQDSLRGIDIAIPCNTAGKHSIALMYWMLAREVLRMKDLVSREQEWNVMVDMFIFRNPDEAEKQIAGTEEPWENKTYPNSSGWQNAPPGEHWEEGEAGTDDYQAPPDQWVGGEQWGEVGAADATEWTAEDAGGTWAGEAEGEAEGNW